MPALASKLSSGAVIAWSFGPLYDLYRRTRKTKDRPLPDANWIGLLFAIGIVMLFAELLIPSFGLLTAIAVGCFIGGIALTFSAYGQTAGLIACIVCAVGLPVGGAIAFRVWPRTWLGRKIIPSNPTLTDADTSIPVAELDALVGKTGRAISTLRPVGICDFNGRRISCVAEYGLVDTGTEVEGIRVLGGNLAVHAKNT